VKQINELSIIILIQFAGRKAGMDNRKLLRIIARRGKFAGKHDMERKSEGLRSGFCLHREQKKNWASL